MQEWSSNAAECPVESPYFGYHNTAELIGRGRGRGRGSDEEAEWAYEFVGSLV